MPTDRKKIKDQQEGTYVTAAGISDAQGAVEDMHSRTVGPIHRPYLANDAATFTQLVAAPQRAVRARAVKINSIVGITGNATNYQKFTFSTQYANGTAKATLGSWNTHTGAQSTIAANTSGTVTIATNADAEIPAGGKLVVIMAPTGDGWNCSQSSTSFTADLEEI
jgi:hypothetical protein